MASNVSDDGSTCSICFETFKKPKLLACGHTFCEFCIHEYIMKRKENQTTGNRIDCPLCRHFTTFENEIPKAWATSLPFNFALESILALSSGKQNDEKTSSGTDSQFACQPCLEHEAHVAATLFCVECNEYICKGCSLLHNRFGFMNDHEIICIEGHEERIQFLSSIKPMQLCSEHKEKVSYSCSDDNKLCCSSCIIEAHKNCEWLSIEQMSEAKSLNKMVNELKQLNRKVKTASMFWATRGDESRRQILDLQKEIQTKRAKINEMFELLERDVIAFVKNVNKESLVRSKKHLACCGQVITNLDKVVFECERALKHGTPVQQYILTHNSHLQERISHSYLNANEEFSKLVSIEVYIKYLALSSFFELPNEQIGEPHAETHRVNVESLPDSRGVKLKLKARVTQESDVWYRSIDFLHDGRLVAADHFRSKLVLLDRNLKRVAEYEMTLKPFSVKVLDNGIILVTSGEENVFFHFKADAENLVPMDAVALSVPCDSISQKDNETFLVGLFGGQTPCGVASSEGNEKDFDIELPKKQYTAENSKCVFDSKSGLLAVSDKNADMVHIVDTRNDTKTSIQCESIMQPRGLAFGKDETVYICSGGTDSIVHVTAEGRLLRSHKLNVAHPYAVCVSRDQTRLAVANMEINDKQVQLFEVHHHIF